MKGLRPPFVATLATFLSLLSAANGFATMAGSSKISFSRRQNYFQPHRMTASVGDFHMDCDPLMEECDVDGTDEDGIQQSKSISPPSPAVLALATVAGLSVLAVAAAATTATASLQQFHDPSSSLMATLHTASNFPHSLWAAYEQVLADSPVATKAVTSATVYTVGDIIAQRTAFAAASLTEDDTTLAVQPPPTLDYARTLRSMLAGLIGHGPMSHVYYNLNEHLFQDILHWNSAWWVFLPKIAIDQAIFGPIWNNSYILLLGLMQGNKIETIVDEMRRTTVPLVLEGLKLWPLVHCVTYGLVPVENRLLWVDAVEIVWVTILATKAAEASKESTTATTTPVTVKP